MHPHLKLSLSLLLLPACAPEGAASTSGDTGTTTTGSTTAADTTSDPPTTTTPTSTDGSGTDNTGTDDTGTADTGTADTGTDDTDTDTDTGAPEDSGAAWVVYRTDDQDDTVPPELYVVDCSGPVPGPATALHEPLPPGAGVENTVAVSPQQRWLGYTVWQAMVGRSQWIVRLDGPTPGVPRKVDLPLQQNFSSLTFAPGEDLVAFGANALNEPAGLYLCQLADDGACAPQLWSVLLGPGGTLSFDSASFSPDASKLAYAADPDGDGIDQLFVTGTAPADAGEAVQVSDVPAGIGALGGIFSPDGLMIYVIVNPGKNQFTPRQLFAVDLAVDPPGPPVLVSPPPVTKEQRFSLRDDTSGMLVWSGDTLFGDLEWVRLDGAEAAPPVPLHSEPGRVLSSSFQWTPDEQRVVYHAEKPDDPGEVDLFMVDLGGGEPAPAVKLSAPSGPGGGISGEVHFGATSDRVFYFASAGAKQGSELWMAGLDPVTPAVKLSAPLPASSSLPGAMQVSNDLARVSYVGPQETEDLFELFLVELAGPSAPVKLNAPLAPGSRVDVGSRFSPDGHRVFFQVKDDADKQRAFQVDVTPTPGAPVQLSDESHDVGSTLLVLPAGP